MIKTRQISALFCMFFTFMAASIGRADDLGRYHFVGLQKVKITPVKLNKPLKVWVFIGGKADKDGLPSKLAESLFNLDDRLKKSMRPFIIRADCGPDEFKCSSSGLQEIVYFPEDNISTEAKFEFTPISFSKQKWGNAIAFDISENGVQIDHFVFLVRPESGQ